MAFTEEERERWDRLVGTFLEEERPPEEIRPKLDLGYSIKDQSIEIFEISPRWDKPEEKIKFPVAKATWVRRRKIWKVYWQRADLKWHSYEPLPQVDTPEEFLEEVKEDPFACFWG